MDRHSQWFNDTTMKFPNLKIGEQNQIWTLDFIKYMMIRLASDSF